MTTGSSGIKGVVVDVRRRVDAVRAWVQDRLVWRIWERMLEIEFVDRSVALAGKAFVSFFPLVIVVAAFMPAGVRSSIFTTLTHRLGLHGQALHTTKQAFAGSDDIRKATGVVGLVLTLFYATSFTTALQRVYLRLAAAAGRVGQPPRRHGSSRCFAFMAVGRSRRCSTDRSRRVLRDPAGDDHEPVVVLRGSCSRARSGGACCSRPV
jgi:hypothetical protein